MGFREVVLLGILLLPSGGNLCAATQIWFNLSAIGTQNQTSQEPATTSLQLPRSSRTNRTEKDSPVPFHASYRLRISQLRKPDKRTSPQPHMEQLQTFLNPAASQASQRGGAVQAQEMLKPLVQGPDLNPPLKPESKVLMKSERRVPMPAASVAVRCGEREVTIEVKQNFLGNGQLIRPSDLTMGGCTAVHTNDHILQFQTELQGCGSILTMTKEVLIYSFSLKYSPSPIGDTVILKTSPAEVVIECHYRRKHFVSSGAMRPTWKPFASKTLAEQQLHFSLHLMTEDWQSQRPSNVFFLSDVMRLEATVLQGHHVPLRLYVDSCVATVDPDPNSQPRYPFISNHGCLSDAKLTGAKSYFMQRSQEDKLQFQLKAFRFHQDPKNSLYITCHLKATALSVPIDSQHKACSFLTEANRWVASGGDNKVCSCCESSCSQRRERRGLATDAGLPPHLQWEGTIALGPILVEHGILVEELLSELPPGPASRLQTDEATPAASSSSMALLCGTGTALALVLLVFMAATICSRTHQSKGHTVHT